MSLTEDNTIGEAIEYVNRHREKGVDCPVCDQFVKVYKRKLTASQIRTLAALANHPNEWVHINSEIRQIARDFATVSYFLLAEQQTTRRLDGGRSGYWRVTPEGVKFLKGEIGVAKYAHVYNNEVKWYEGETTYVTDVDPEFNFRELMAGV